MSALWNFTINDSSSIVNYEPYADGALDGGWQSWFSETGFNTAGGEEAKGTSRHVTALPGASLSLEFYGTAVYLFGSASCPYDVMVDNNIYSQTAGSGDVLFMEDGLSPGKHFLNLTARPTPDVSGQVWFDQAIFTDTLPDGVTSFDKLVVDNQNSTVLHYNGNWTEENDPQIPSRSGPKPYMQTKSQSSSMAMNFTGAWAIAVNGPRNWGHWTYNVTLDGFSRQYNASTWWLIGDAILFYQSDLDVQANHTLEITNTGSDGLDFTLNDVTLYTVPGMDAFHAGSSSASIASGATHNGPNIGLIVGPIAGGVVLLFALAVGIIFWRSRRKRQCTDFDILDREVAAIPPFQSTPVPYIGSVRDPSYFPGDQYGDKAPYSGKWVETPVTSRDHSSTRTSHHRTDSDQSSVESPQLARFAPVVLSYPALPSPYSPPGTPAPPRETPSSSADTHKAMENIPRQSTVDVNTIIELIAERIDRAERTPRDEEGKPPQYPEP